MVMGFTPRPVKSNAVLKTVRCRYDVFSELGSLGAESHKWAQSPGFFLTARFFDVFLVNLDVF